MANGFSKVANFMKAVLIAAVLAAGAGGAAFGAASHTDMCWDNSQVERYFMLRNYQLVTVEPGTNRDEYIVHASKKRVNWAFSFDGCRRKVVDKWRAEGRDPKPE
jgi:hypothetical protein